MSKLAVIVGATGGIGASFARHLASLKYDLLIANINIQKLKEEEEELEKQYGVKVEREVLNLTDENLLSVFTKKIGERDNIEMLVSCAGFGEGKTFCEEEVEQQLKMIQVHLVSTVIILHAVLPGMIKRRKGNIITVSSLSAFIPAPGSSIYAATKSFLNSFMESIHMEVSKYGVQIQSLCPGLTRTDFHNVLEKAGNRSGLNKVIPFMEPDEVVNYSLRCLKKGKVVCVPGWFNKSVKNAIQIFPRRMFYSLSKKFAEK